MASNLTEKTYLSLRDKLTRGKLSAGVRLSSRAMAKDLGVSLTPVRGAFNRLISEGLLEHHAGLGVFVPTPNHREVEDIYEFRVILECAAVSKVCGRLSEAELGEMERCLEEEIAIGERFISANGETENSDVAESWRANDEAFHLAIMRAAGNRRILETVAELRAKSRIVCHTFKNGEPVERERTRNEHRLILDALRIGDADEGQRLMTAHVDNGRQLALDATDARYMEDRHVNQFRSYHTHKAHEPS